MSVAAPPLAFLDTRFWVTTGAFVASLLIGAYIIWAVRRWQKDGAARVSANEQLSHYRTLYEKGEISEQEFNQLRGVLGGEIRQSLGIKKKPPEAGPPPDGITKD